MRTWTKRDPVKNYFPLPNEIYQLGLSHGAIAVYGYLHIEGIVIQFNGCAIDARKILPGEGRSCLNRGSGFFVF